MHLAVVIIITVIILTLLSVLIQKNSLKTLNILRKTYRRDARTYWRFFKLLCTLKKYQYCNVNLIKLFDGHLKSHPEKTAMYYQDEQWTYNDIESFSNQIAHCFKNEGFKNGDCVALVLNASPEYVCTWFGLAKIRVVTALINTNLVGKPLYHSIAAANCNAIIFDDTFASAIENIKADLGNTKLYQLNSKMTPDVDLLANARHLRQMLANMPTNPIEKSMLEQISSNDKLLYIFTSGTTGLPKAAIVTHNRFMFITATVKNMLNLHKSDCVYNCLPLYHSSGGIVVVGQPLANGITAAMRNKFSATNFWSDCINYKCTAIVYIGEMCRYLLSAHSQSETKIKHHVRLMTGPGLKSHIWQKFVDRFQIKEVYELYGSTEGNSNLVNMDSKVGAVGFIPIYLRNVFPVTLVKCNQETGEVLRDNDGHCMRCSVDEPGIAIGRISKATSALNFSGYSNKKETTKKILRDVFRRGDEYFNSGDILVQDELGYMYFKDRTGDTYRWKAENVSTTEVETVLSDVVNYRDISVYGVEVSGHEGRAGMAAIVDSDCTLDLKTVSAKLTSKLPKYAIPLFLRIVTSIPITATYKLKKFELRNEGYNPQVVTDKLYLYNAATTMYEELTTSLYQQLLDGNIKV